MRYRSPGLNTGCDGERQNNSSLTLFIHRLWHLFQTRNLIVHRRGVVDQHYIEKTGTTLPIGTHMWVTPAEIEDFFAAVVAAVEEIVGEVTNVG